MIHLACVKEECECARMVCGVRVPTHLEPVHGVIDSVGARMLDEYSQ